jgi:hypothetical protein
MCKRLNEKFELREFKGNQEFLFWEVWFKKNDDMVKLKGILVKEILMKENFLPTNGYEILVLEKSRNIGVYHIGDSLLIRFLTEVSKSELGRNVNDWYDLVFSTGYISSSNLLKLWVERWGITELQNDLKWLCESNPEIRNGFKHHPILNKFIPNGVETSLEN